LKISLKRRRVAVSELVGTLIMVAITLTAGAAVFGWINGQASSSEGAYGASVANNINFLKERFVVVSQSFAGSTCTSTQFSECTQASFWLYNSGQVGFTLQSISFVSQSSAYPLDITFYPASSAGCSSTTQTCGFVVYSGSSPVCSDTAAWSSVNDQPGFYQNSLPPATLAQGQLTTNPYQITMPTGIVSSSTCSSGGSWYLYEGVTYALTFTGVYGNTVSTTVTVNG
jgi:flagellin-like protein